MVGLVVINASLIESESSIPNLLPIVGRSKGFHVTDAIMWYCIERGILQPVEFHDHTWSQLGLAFEDMISIRFSQEFPGRYKKVGEIFYDGVYLTPDLYDVKMKEPVEIKLSWMSAFNDPFSEKMTRYVMQCQSYAHVTGSLTCKLCVCFVNGYGDKKPVFKSWRLEFSKNEMILHWALIKSIQFEIERNRSSGDE